MSPGRHTLYEMGTRRRKPTPKTDSLGQSAHNGSETHHTHMMEANDNQRDCVLPVGIRQVGRAQGPKLRMGPPSTTGGHRTSECGVRFSMQREKATGPHNRPLNILQWNAEGIGNKKVPLTERLSKESIDVACIQESHLTPERRFNIRGYQTLRHDRTSKQKGGVLILVKLGLLRKDFTIETNQQSEIQAATISLGTRDLTIYNCYCPPDKEPSLQSLNTPRENCLIVGDFNSRSTSWGYDDTDKRGDEVEDWQIENSLLLLNAPDDMPTFYSRRWMTTTTPDLAFASGDLSSKTARTVLDPLGGSDHRPIKLSINLNYSPPDSKTFPRWNYNKANWTNFKTLSDQYTKNIKTEDQNLDRVTGKFNKAILKAAAESIPRGARYNYKPYWTDELQKQEDEATKAREAAEEQPDEENNIALKAATARYRKTYRQAARKNWIKKTESLNLDREGHKLWRLTKALNNENSSTAPILQQPPFFSNTMKTFSRVKMQQMHWQITMKMPATLKSQHREEQKYYGK